MHPGGGGGLARDRWGGVMAEQFAQFREDFQYTALFLVIWGSLMTWLACHSNYPELKTLVAGIAGAGNQAITSQVRNILNNRSGGVINNVAEAPTPHTGATT